MFFSQSIEDKTLQTEMLIESDISGAQLTNNLYLLTFCSVMKFKRISW